MPVWRDLRFALRGFRKQPSFPLLAVVALGLGIGAATTIFSVIQNVLLDPFPYTDAARVATFHIHNLADSSPYGRSAFPPDEFLEYQRGNHVFSEVIGGSMQDVQFTGEEGAELWQGGAVTANTFRFLGVPAILGRVMTPDDAAPGAPPVFLMAHKLWVKRFHSDPSIVGRTFNLNNTPTTLVGIMPKRFTKLGADIWTVLNVDPADALAGERFLRFQARMKPGVTLKQVEADINPLAHHIAELHPKNYPKRFDIRAESWLDSLVQQFRTTLYTLAAAVALLLLIACGNVANMLLARATAREKEMAIRASVGASRTRIVGQLLIESLLLALGGAVLGCLLAWAGIQAVTGMMPEGLIPREVDIRLNGPVLLFSVGIAIVTALLFGLAPALHVSRRDFVEPLKDAGKGNSGGFRKGRVRNALVVVEVALSLVLLSGAGLLMRSFAGLQMQDLGMRTDHVLVSRLPFPKGQYATAAEQQRFFRSLMQRLHTLPGATASAISTTLPPFGGYGSAVEVVGLVHDERWQAVLTLCSEGYFETLGIRLQRGRLLSETEIDGARKVAVVNQAFVAKYLNNRDPIGRFVRLNALETARTEPLPNATFEIVGVVNDSKNDDIAKPAVPEVFVPHTVTGLFDRLLLVKSTGDPLALVNSVRREIWAVDRGIALTETDSLENFMRRYLYAEPRFSMILLAIFAATGLALATIGVYSVIAYTVTRQTHEIGIRMALGAARRDVFRLVLAMGLRLLGVGALVGVAVSFVVTRVLRSQLTNVSPGDPLTLASVVVVLAAVGLLACYFPARRATRVDPIIALRYE